VLAAIAARACRRVLRWFARSERLEAADAKDSLRSEHGVFSLDAAVRIGDDDCAGLCPSYGASIKINDNDNDNDNDYGTTTIS
jgi:hypothetical protein